MSDEEIWVDTPIKKKDSKAKKYSTTLEVGSPFNLDKHMQEAEEIVQKEASAKARRRKKKPAHQKPVVRKVDFQDENTNQNQKNNGQTSKPQSPKFKKPEPRAVKQKKDKEEPKKKSKFLERIFSSASDVNKVDQKEFDRQDFLRQQEILDKQFEAELFKVNLELSEVRQQLSEMTDDRDLWKERCLKQQEKIEEMEKNAEKLKQVMVSNHYVPGGAFSAREPSFCPEF